MPEAGFNKNTAFLFCPAVILCGWWDVKIQQLNFSHQRVANFFSIASLLRLNLSFLAMLNLYVAQFGFNSHTPFLTNLQKRSLPFSDSPFPAHSPCWPAAWGQCWHRSPLLTPSDHGSPTSLHRSSYLDEHNYTRQKVSNRILNNNKKHTPQHGMFG